MFKTWTEKYIADFTENAELLNKLNEFVDKSLAVDYEVLANNLKKLLTTEVKKKKFLKFFLRIFITENNTSPCLFI